MGKSLNLLIENKDAIIALAAQYGIDELEYAPVVFPSEVEIGTVNLLATKRQPAEQRIHITAGFQHVLKKTFGIDANVFTPEGIKEGIARESHYTPTSSWTQVKYQPIIDTAFPLIDITQQNSTTSIIETPSPDISALVAQYRERKRLRTSEPATATDELPAHATDKGPAAQKFQP